MEFESGLIANVELSWLAPSKLRRTVVVGSQRMVVYEDGGAEAIKIYDRGVDYKEPESFGEYQLSYRSGDILSPHLAGDEPLALQLEDFVCAISNGDSSEPRLELAREVVRLAEAADASLSAGGMQIALGPGELVRGTAMMEATRASIGVAEATASASRATWGSARITAEELVRLDHLT